MNTKMFSIVSKTWNPVKGCLYNCRYCWAKKLSKRLYNDEFIPRLFEKRLKFKEKNKTVFTCDMGDLFGEFIPSEWIEKVIKSIRNADKSNTFMFLTKNPIRYHEFLKKIPNNVILGVTIETNYDQIVKKISRAPLPSERRKAFVDIKDHRKMISIEPILDFDLNEFLSWIKEMNPDFVYIGYDNYRNMLTEPKLGKVMQLIRELEKFGINVFRKTIRKGWFETTRTTKNYSLQSF